MRQVATACLLILAIPATQAFCDWQEPPSGLPGNFIIGLQSAEVIADGDYALAADAGFNLAVPVRPGLEYARALMWACFCADIRMVAWDPRISTYELNDWDVYSQMFQEYRDFPTVAGYVLYDLLVVPPSRLPSLGWHVREIGGADGFRFRYAEVVPMSGFPDENAYRQYLRQYYRAGCAFAVYEETAPFSRDAIRAMKATAEGAAQATEEGRQAPAYQRITVRREWWRRCRLADADPAMLRWQAYSAAAAGARGIIYLVARPVGAGSCSARTDSLLDAAGAPSAAFDVTKAANTRLAAVGRMLMAATSSSFYTLGTMPESLPAPAGAPIASVRSSAENDGFLVGVLNDGAARYAFIVRAPSPGRQPAQVQIELAANTTATIAETGQPLNGPLALLPGEGQLLQIRR